MINSWIKISNVILNKKLFEFLHLHYAQPLAIIWISSIYIIFLVENVDFFATFHCCSFWRVLLPLESYYVVPLHQVTAPCSNTFGYTVCQLNIVPCRGVDVQVFWVYNVQAFAKGTNYTVDVVRAVSAISRGNVSFICIGIPILFVEQFVPQGSVLDFMLYTTSLCAALSIDI